MDRFILATLGALAAGYVAHELMVDHGQRAREQARQRALATADAQDRADLDLLYAQRLGARGRERAILTRGIHEIERRRRHRWEAAHVA
ncbi:MAG: hypothetical protein KC613_22160 [Myxococcales bacterium]|nr:hypothetical protein [Myxococcales bacterium]MCB9524027.1 hypothetical protein [Myxococcales bacterium]